MRVARQNIDGPQPCAIKYKYNNFVCGVDAIEELYECVIFMPNMVYLRVYNINESVFSWLFVKRDDDCSRQ